MDCTVRIVMHWRIDLESLPPSHAVGKLGAIIGVLRYCDERAAGLWQLLSRDGGWEDGRRVERREKHGCYEMCPFWMYLF